jgi:hypothetical protein
MAGNSSYLLVLLRSFFSRRWVYAWLLYAALMAMMLCLGDWRHHRALSWWNLLPFAGWVLPLAGMIGIELWRYRRYCRSSQFSA